MKILHTFPLVSAVIMLFAAGCRKENNDKQDPSISGDDCVTQASAGTSPDGQYIVSYKPAAARRAAGAVSMRAIGESVLARQQVNEISLTATFEGEPGGFIARLSAEQAQNIANDPDVERVEPDRIIRLGTCFTVVEPRLITWNIERVGYGDGRGKTAWVIDSGIDFDHPDLDVDVARSKSFINGVTSAEDENGHGTHVAGIIGGKNNNFGVLGVASGAKLISLRVLDKEGEGLLSSIIQALGWINTHGKAGDVVNMSVGDEEGISETLDQQVKNTAARGILIAIAAGNEKKAARDFSPGRANAPNIYTVSAIDSLDRFASFSNYGNDVVDYAAPGVRILSTFLNGKYAYISGTSMAAPHMAGLLLLKGNRINVSGTAKNDPDGEADRIAHF